MNIFEAIILGLIQGLTEFLPVSSSGHLELGKYLFGIDPEANFYFSIAVHGATVLSTIVVLWKEIAELTKGLFRFKLNEETLYVAKIFISMIPTAIAGFFLKEIAENYFTGNMIALGIQFMISATTPLNDICYQTKRKTDRFCRFFYNWNCSGFCNSSGYLTFRCNNCNRYDAWK